VVSQIDDREPYHDGRPQHYQEPDDIHVAEAQGRTPWRLRRGGRDGREIELQRPAPEQRGLSLFD